MDGLWCANPRRSRGLTEDSTAIAESGAKGSASENKLVGGGLARRAAPPAGAMLRLASSPRPPLCRCCGLFRRWRGAHARRRAR